jgi:N-acyl-D-aspartate/D-glutamate deacylase
VTAWLHGWLADSLADSLNEAPLCIVHGWGSDIWLQEAFLIGREAGNVPVVLSHHKVAGKEHWGTTVDKLALFEEASKTQPLAIDVYPYAASSTVLKMDAARRSSKVVITWSKAMPQAAGQTLASLAEQCCCSEEAAAAQLQPAGAIYFSMDEDDVRRVLCHPRCMVRGLLSTPALHGSPLDGLGPLQRRDSCFGLRGPRH